MAPPSKPPPESSDQVKELAETLKNLALHGIRFVDSFMNQVRTALSQQSEPFHPPAQDNYPQANLHEGEQLKAAQPSLFSSSSFDSANQSDVMAPSKSPLESSDQAGEPAETLENLALLGLRLDKDDSFMNLMRTAVPLKSEPFHPLAQVTNPQADLHDGEKLKAAQVPVTLIRIGSWQFASVHEADLVAKFHFATRKLVWEVLVNGLKNMMEIRWSDISAIRATIEENKPGILEIELHQPPTFYKETDPQPQHHSIRISAEDFTGGQALMCRRHYLEFPSAALDRHYVKLLSSDLRLLQLSQSGFPSSADTIFCTLQHFNYNSQCLKDQFSYHGFENSQMTRVSNNLSQFGALPPLHPAATAAVDPDLREDFNSPSVGEGGDPTLQTPAIMSNTQQQLVLDADPISWYHPRLSPAINGTFTSHTGSLNAIGSASNGDAMGVRQEQDEYANSSGKFISPSEQNGTFISPIGSSSAGGSASNGDAMGWTGK